MHLRVPLRHIPHSLDRQRFRHFAKAIVWLGGGKQMLKLSWWLVALQLSSSYYHVCTLIKASCSQLPRALTAQHSSTTTIWNKILQASSDFRHWICQNHAPCSPLAQLKHQESIEFFWVHPVPKCSINPRTPTTSASWDDNRNWPAFICVHHRPWGPEFRIHEIQMTFWNTHILCSIRRMQWYTDVPYLIYVCFFNTNALSL